MTIEEAVDLVVYASAENIFNSSMQRGCINVLNMGASVKIDDLAKQIIRLLGWSSKVIKIKYIGLKKERNYMKSFTVIMKKKLHRIKTDTF